MGGLIKMNNYKSYCRDILAILYCIILMFTTAIFPIIGYIAGVIAVGCIGFYNIGRRLDHIYEVSKFDKEVNNTDTE